MKNIAKTITLLFGFIALIIGSYFAIALIAARIENGSTFAVGPNEPKKHTIYLVTNLLHADIAVPVHADTLAEFSMLQNTPLPFDNPNMKYVLFGWGSKAFYTTAGSYSDIKISAVFRAVTGDQAVMRVSAAGELKTDANIIPLKISDRQLRLLYSGIMGGFSQTNGEAKRVTGASLDGYDAFFEGNGDFNIFYPCNQWVNSVFQKAGIRLGFWTLTTQSLIHSLRYFDEDKS